MALSQGIVINPASSNQSDGSIINIGMGRQNEQMVSPVHGRWYTAAYRGKLFRGSTAAAGTTIPISSATAATFTLYNPIGSGVNVELVRYMSSVQNASTVVSNILLGISSPLTVAPTGLTALTTGPALLGGAATPAAQLYSIATITATTVFYQLGGYGATTCVTQSMIDHIFEGMVMIAPGTLVHVCGTAAQTSASTQTIVWAEWPI